MNPKKYIVEEVELKELIAKVANVCEKINASDANSIEKPVSFEETMQYLNIPSKKKLHSLMNDANNPIPFHKIGRSTVFFLSEVKDWLRAN